MCAPELIDSVASPCGLVAAPPRPARRGFMKTLATGLVVGAAGAVTAGASPVQAAAGRGRGFGRVVDLTHTVTPDFPVWTQVSKPPQLIPVSRMAQNRYNGDEIVTYEHVGTHVDAPLHFSDGGLSVDRIPADQLVAPLAVLRIADRAARDPSAAVTVADIRAWEAAHGPLPDGAFVAMDSGWSQRISVPGAYLNYDERRNVYRWPGFSAEAADFLIRQRRVVGIGVDSTGLDRGSDHAVPVHRSWLPAGRYGVESLADLDQVPDAGATLIVGAPKHGGGTGGPARVFALF
ncbi:MULTISPECIES: cyclase family protein [Nocardia]|uniref:cyclase family protein n=1 Tax=Nocardia TaxID=1817 RepID=UPI000318D621|nr:MULTISPECIES: cyclase family protein [Nocardia]